MYDPDAGSRSRRRQAWLTAIAVFITIPLVVGGLLWDRSRGSTTEVDTREAGPTNFAPTNNNVLPPIRGGRDPLRVVAVGDYLLNGAYASVADTTFYSAVAASIGAVRPVESTVRIAPPASISTFPTDIQISGPADLILVSFGTYDATLQTDPSVFEDALARILEVVRTASPTAALVCTGAWYDPTIVINYDRAIQKQCTERGGVYRRVSDLFRNGTLRGPAGSDSFLGRSDGVYPNDAGHTEIAARILQPLGLKLREG